jgi:hypothetical protein
LIDATTPDVQGLIDTETLDVRLASGIFKPGFQNISGFPSLLPLARIAGFRQNFTRGRSHPAAGSPPLQLSFSTARQHIAETAGKAAFKKSRTDLSPSSACEKEL